MGADRPRDEDPEPRDAWREADRAWEAKWSDRRPADDDEWAAPPPEGYAPRKATIGGTTDAYGDGMRAAGPYIGLGVQIGASMALFAGGGILVDRWLGTSPWGIIVGAALGMVGVLALVVRVANESSGRENDREQGG